MEAFNYDLVQVPDNLNGGGQPPQRKSQAIDIIDPETGKKIAIREFYADDNGFYAADGVYYPYYTYNELYQENSGGFSAVYFSAESQSTGGVQPPKRKNQAIDIIDPETGEKIEIL